MKISDFNYNLPNSLIADIPPKIRGMSRLLVLNRKTGDVIDKKYFDIADYLQSGDVLVLNKTKVIKARLKTITESGSNRELVILEKHSFDNDWHRHRVMYRKKLNVGDKLAIGDSKIFVEQIQGDGLAIVKCNHDLLDITEKFGEVPLPPYMHRDANESDVERYQTVWAKDVGSVAAPTASLNMTDELLTTLTNMGVMIVYLTLHVGLGTFMPIRADNIEDHHMHQEYFEIPSKTVETIQKAKLSGKRIVALGTTVARSLEYSYKVFDQASVDVSGEADIFIYPGYRFKVVDSLITNFHAPKSTVLMLTAAFAGWDKILPAYNHAISEKYNFLSYGDSMLIL
ncbi:MAG: tRNA preQ1(34) S-adenosylmethionine ribosyltransferase-isomerase QueA [Candidatus Saccharibacteria bacterium]